MRAQLLIIVKRLKNPSVILSIVSQIVTILLMVGIKVNQNVILAIATALCSIFVTLGIISDPDSTKLGYGDDILPCSITGEDQKHVLINGKMVCVKSGAEFVPPSDQDANTTT